MKLFTLDQDGKLIPYQERIYAESHREIDLEVLLEKNPDYFFEQSKILIIGRQVTTDLNKYIDLLGVDIFGNAIAIELKRGKTPRETIAQILEYASYVERLDYARLNLIFQTYYGEETDLEDYHRQYFEIEPSVPVSYNKSVKLVIVAQEISPEIKQTALYLGGKGVSIYCIEFKYFETSSGEKIVTSDFVVGEDDIVGPIVVQKSLPPISKDQFVQRLDQDGRPIFSRLFDFADENSLIVTWGTVGFSLSIGLNAKRIPFIYGYPPDSAYPQSIYTDSLRLLKLPGFGEIAAWYRAAIEGLPYFLNAGKTGNSWKWLIDKTCSENDLNAFLDIVRELAEKVRSYEMTGA